MSIFPLDLNPASSEMIGECCIVVYFSVIGNTTVPLMRFNPQLSAVLRIFFDCGRLRLSRRRSWKVHILIAVNTVPSRSSRWHKCSFLWFSAV